MANHSKNSSSVGQLIPKCKEDIRMILLKYKAFHEPCDAEIILKFTNDLLEDFTKVFVNFIEEVISEINPPQNGIIKQEDDVIIVEDDKVDIKREDGPHIDLEKPELRRPHEAEIDPKMLNESSSNMLMKSIGAVVGVKEGCEIIDLDAPEYGKFEDLKSNSKLLNGVCSDIMPDKILTQAKKISPIMRRSEQFDLVRPHSKKHKGSIHETTNPLDCEICNKRTETQGRLTFHRKNHLNEYPIHCRICLRFFSSDRRRVAHQEECNIRRYDCYACGKIQQCYTDLQNHFRTHSGDKPFKCKMCSKRFIRKWNLHKHLKTMHKRNK